MRAVHGRRVHADVGYFIGVGERDEQSGWDLVPVDLPYLFEEIEPTPAREILALATLRERLFCLA